MNTIWLSGELAGHRRGRILEEAVTAERLEGAQPSSGMVLQFGTDFQSAPEERQSEWAEWCAVSGRCLLLLPPFRTGTVAQPRQWQVHSIPGGQAKAAEHPLQRLLAREARFYLSGGLQPTELLGGIWGDGTINTGFYRKHPVAGLFVVTCLPIWSIAILEHRRELRDWLTGLQDLAGPVVAFEAGEPSFFPTEEHVALLLHLGSKLYTDAETAQGDLGRSPYFRVPSEKMEQLLRDLQQDGMLDGLRLTNGARDWLLASPYASYLDALQEARS
jgi:hypothetical protein